VQIGRFDYQIYANNQMTRMDDINQAPIKLSGESPVRVSDVGREGRLYGAIQRSESRRPAISLSPNPQAGRRFQYYCSRRWRAAEAAPSTLASEVVFDQSQFVKTAIATLIHEGGIGLILTCLMVLIFLGSFRSMLAVSFSIPISACATPTRWQFDQHHGARRTGSGFFAPDR
jgi:multidrug efflux pump subunit AcrB